jgi:predicted GTPase
VILWDGGNNDLPFFRPDLLLTVVDPLRAGDEVAYHPGEACLRRGDAVLINKVDVATEAQLERVLDSVRRLNPNAPVLRAASPVAVDDPAAVRGRRVLVVEDGPTVTHGGMPGGAGLAAARRFGALEVVDPRPWAVGGVAALFQQYPHLGPVLPAVGYGDAQRRDLAATIAVTPCDLVLVATPIDLARVVPITRPVVRVSYSVEVQGSPTLTDLLRPFLTP